MTIRPIHIPEDMAALTLLDASFSTSRLFRIRCEGLCFELVEESVAPPFGKSYDLSGLTDDLLPSDHTFLAEDAGEVVGLASMRLESWNNRSVLRHLYIAPEHRRRGAGRSLMEAVFALSEAAGARCLWVETQNTNYPAIQFYLREGFQLCGLDASLYDQPGSSVEETALFFSKPANRQNG